MANRPKVIALDIIGTTFSLEPMRERLVALGLPSHALELWFATGLRDVFALAASESFQPFRSVLESALDQILLKNCRTATSDQKQELLKGMLELPPHPDARQALEILKAADIRIMALTN